MVFWQLLLHMQCPNFHSNVPESDTICAISINEIENSLNSSKNIQVLSRIEYYVAIIK